MCAIAEVKPFVILTSSGWPAIAWPAGTLVQGTLALDGFTRAIPSPHVRVWLVKGMDVVQHDAVRHEGGRF